MSTNITYHKSTYLQDKIITYFFYFFYFMDHGMIFINIANMCLAFVSGWYYINRWITSWILRWVLKWWKLFDSKSTASATDCTSSATSSNSCCCTNIKKLWKRKESTAGGASDKWEIDWQSQITPRITLKFTSKYFTKLDSIRSITSFNGWR